MSDSRIRKCADVYRKQVPGFAQWARGYGMIHHTDSTQVKIGEMVDFLSRRGHVEAERAFRILTAADRITSAAMWLVVHMTYARNVSLEGRALEASDFKTHPEGHTGGSLNMVPAYTGYLTINALTRLTRSWVMGQGHCVAAIDSTNVLVGNLTPEHRQRYDLSNEGLTRLVRDFYSYAVTPEGKPESPLGSHVNAHTAGGLLEGGYLGFTELLYPHMPLAGERLVVFLSDGAFEEQRGSDWAPRWWRAPDSGLVSPIMIANGRRIDQRTTMNQAGGIHWFRDHLRLNGFDPIDIDGRDPAAFAWAIFEMEERLAARGQSAEEGQAQYPVLLPYTIAKTIKGYGFPGAGTNQAHNLPLSGNPATSSRPLLEFNSGAGALFVPLDELKSAIESLNEGVGTERPAERDHPLVSRHPPRVKLPEPSWTPDEKESASPMEAVDAEFCRILIANPNLRPRVGNPDELRSNRMNKTLDLLKHRVTAPEAGIAESVDGAVITALNEEAIVCAALGNQGGINLAVSYEAFAVKMLGVIRQELIFARHLTEAGRPPGWISVPVILTSHTWENGKNEQSHQDPTLAETLLGEMSDKSRVMFAADANSAVAQLRAVYASRGTICTLVIPKLAVKNQFSPTDAERLAQDGACRVRGDTSSGPLLIATGAYQLAEAIRASGRLAERDLPTSVIYLGEPGRFREPRDFQETSAMAPEEVRGNLFPPSARVRIFLSHTRPESLLGIVRPLDTGPGSTYALGYLNRGGTLNVSGMLFANRCTWAHAVVAVATALGQNPARYLEEAELRAARGEGDPHVVVDLPTELVS